MPTQYHKIAELMLWLWCSCHFVFIHFSLSRMLVSVCESLYIRTSWVPIVCLQNNYECMIWLHFMIDLILTKWNLRRIKWDRAQGWVVKAVWNPKRATIIIWYQNWYIRLTGGLANGQTYNTLNYFNKRHAN